MTTPIRLTGTCVCGHTPDDPNEDCERCMMVRYIRSCVSTEYRYWARHYSDSRAAEYVTEGTPLDTAEVRQIVGLDPAPVPAVSTSVAGVGGVGVIDEEVA